MAASPSSFSTVMSFHNSLNVSEEFTIEMAIGNERKPVTLGGPDSFRKRNFTGSAEFDDTLTEGEGRIEAS